MINITSNFENIGQSEEISFNTKIFESLNKKEYRKKLQEKENIYKTFTFKTFTSKELNFLENVSIEAIDKQCYLTTYSSVLAFNYVSNINNKYIYIKVKTLNNIILDKYNLDFLDNYYLNSIFQLYLKISDGVNEEYIKIKTKQIVTINNTKYYKIYLQTYNSNNVVIADYLQNSYQKDITTLSYFIKTEIQNKNLDIKETFKKNGEVKIKFKIIDEKGRY